MKGTGVTIYADAEGALSFYRTPDSTEVPCELTEGYRIDDGLYGGRRVFGPPGTLGLSLDQAIRQGVLRRLPTSSS